MDVERDGRKRGSKRSRSMDSNEGHRNYDHRRGSDGLHDRDREGYRRRESNERRDRYGHRDVDRDRHDDRHREGHRRRGRNDDHHGHRHHEGQRALDSDDEWDPHRDGDEHRHREDDSYRYRDGDGRRLDSHDHRYEDKRGYRYDDSRRHDRNGHSNREPQQQGYYNKEGQNQDPKPVGEKTRREYKGSRNLVEYEVEEVSTLSTQALEPRSSCLVLDNVFDKTVKNDNEYYLDIEDVIGEFCAKFGSVEHIHAHRHHGLVYLRFSNPRIAALAQETFHGSKFEGTGRLITAKFLSDRAYKAKFPTKWGQH